MIGETLGPYEIESLLGQGGMGEVYRARDSRLGREVAIKVLNDRISASPDARKRLIREARALAAVHHPGIATLFGFESFDGREMLVMELVEGRTLTAVLREGITPDRALNILVQATAALAEAHAHGIVHRDLKPDNLMILPDDTVKVLDFGLAAAEADTRITQEGALLGTIAYMSPEQARGEVADRRSDLFSLGAIAWEMLTGSRLFTGDNSSGLLHRIAGLTEAPKLERRHDLPGGLAGVVESCLEPDPAARPSTAGDLLASLKPGTRPEPAARPRNSRWVQLGFAVALVALVAWFGTDQWRGADSSKDTPFGEGVLAVLPFRDLDPDAGVGWLSVAASELLATTMAGSPTVDVISPERVKMILEQGSEAAQASLAAAGVGYSISGSVLGGPAGIRVETRLVDNSSGELLHSAVGEGATHDDLYEIVGELDRSYRQFLEVRTISERIDEEWIQDLPTYSIEAYRAYARGREHLSAARWELAVEFFSEAVAIDSTFVSAWVDLASSYWNLDRGDELDEAFARATQLRDRASARGRIWLDLFGAVMEGDGPRITQFAREMLESEPENRFVRYLLGKGYYEQENWQESVAQWKPLREERWTWIWTYLYSSRALSRLERFDEARRALHELEEILAPTDIYSRSRTQRYLGLAELDAGQADAALAAFQATAEIDPAYGEFLYDRGRVHLLAGREVEARADLESYIAMPQPAHFVSEAQELLNQMQ